MQLKQIDILNYKSITSPVSIKFKEGEVVTLIGKNGSGKTNILEALKRIFTNSPFTLLTVPLAQRHIIIFSLRMKREKNIFKLLSSMKRMA